jgi:hypothetical protein
MNQDLYIQNRVMTCGRTYGCTVRQTYEPTICSLFLTKWASTANGRLALTYLETNFRAYLGRLLSEVQKRNDRFS